MLGFGKIPTRHSLDFGAGDDGEAASVRVSGGGKHFVDSTLTPKGFEKITGLSSAKSLTVPSGSRLALVQCETQDVRWRDDGTAPTAAVGFLLETSVNFWYSGDLSALQLIETNASAVVNVCYYA